MALQFISHLAHLLAHDVEYSLVYRLPVLTATSKQAQHRPWCLYDTTTFITQILYKEQRDARRMQWGMRKVYLMSERSSGA